MVRIVNKYDVKYIDLNKIRAQNFGKSYLIKYLNGNPENYKYEIEDIYTKSKSKILDDYEKGNIFILADTPFAPALNYVKEKDNKKGYYTLNSTKNSASLFFNSSLEYLLRTLKPQYGAEVISIVEPKVKIIEPKEELEPEIKEPEIIDGFWLNNKDERITLSQEDTDVKIKIITSNVSNGTTIKGKVLKSIFGYDKKVGIFSGKVNNNQAIIDFKLNNKIVKDDSSEIEKLYFEAELEDAKKKVSKELPLKEENYLQVVERAILVSVFVELPNHKSFNQKRIDAQNPNSSYKNEAMQDLGLSGHAGIAIDGEYYDYGPNGSALESNGTPWWDLETRENEDDTRQYTMTDLDGKDIQRVKNQMKAGIGDASQPIKEIQILVTRNQAKTLKQWWDNKYKKLGTYTALPWKDGEHCTSTVMESLYKADVIGNGLLGTISYETEITDPEEFYDHFLKNVKHTAGFLVNGKIPNDLNSVPTSASAAPSKVAIEIQIR